MFARNFVFTSESLSFFMGIVSKFYLFVDNNTPVANISAYFKFIVSYCCSRATLKWIERSRYVTFPWQTNFWISGETWSCVCFRSANEPKSLNVELFEYSNGVLRGSIRGRNQPKDGHCPDYIRKPVSVSQSMQTSEEGSRKSSTTPIL